MSKKNFVVFIICILVFILPAFFESLRYIKYISPFIVWIVIGSSKIKIDSIIGNYLKLYLFIFIFLFSLSPVYHFNSVRAFQTIVFILSPLFLGLILYSYYGYVKDLIKILFFSSIIAYLLDFYDSIIEVLISLNFVEFFINSNIKSESSLAFVFGFFSLYFLFKKDYKFLIFSILFMIISGKRIVLLGFCFSCLIYVLGNNSNYKFNYRGKIAFLALFFNLLFVYLVFLLTNNYFDDNITEYTGLSPNAFLMGRQFLYTEIFNSFSKDINGVGLGLGRLDTFVLGLDVGLTNPHSDILKNFLEFGIILFSIWIFIFYYLASFSFNSFILTVYLNVVFLSDNAFIYFDVMLVFYLILTEFRVIEEMNKFKNVNICKEYI